MDVKRNNEYRFEEGVYPRIKIHTNAVNVYYHWGFIIEETNLKKQ